MQNSVALSQVLDKLARFITGLKLQVSVNATSLAEFITDVWSTLMQSFKKNWKGTVQE